MNCAASSSEGKGKDWSVLRLLETSVGSYWRDKEQRQTVFSAFCLFSPKTGHTETEPKNNDFFFFMGSEEFEFGFFVKLEDCLYC